jgi:adenylate cyclase
MTTQEVKRKLTAILSADVKGYSRLMGEDEKGTVHTLNAYKEVITGLIQHHHGRLVDAPGDNLLAEFGSVVDAVECAVEIQKGLKTRNAELPENRRMEFRIGVNLGDVIEEGDRIYGDGVNIAARLESLSEAGGICISGTAFDQVKNKINLGYKYLGEQTVKNILEPVRVYQVLMEPEAAGKVIGEKKAKPRQRQRVTIGLLVAVIVVIAAVVVWRLYFSPPPSEEVASKEKIAFPLPDKPSIAVLPFINMSEDPKQEYFSDGITEDIITNLSKVSGLVVISRNSSFLYKGKQVKIQEVAKDLGVRYVLEGSIRRGGNKVRVTAQLIDGKTAQHVWADSYDREQKDIFSVQDEITRKVVSELAVALTVDETGRLIRKHTENFEAYDLYLRARTESWVIKKESDLKVIEMLRQVINLDPNFAGGYNHLSLMLSRGIRFGWSASPREDLEKAFELAQKAISVDDKFPLSYYSLASVYLMKGKHDNALAAINTGVSMAPNDDVMRLWLGYHLNWVGRGEEAVSAVKKSMELNPMYLHGRNTMYLDFMAQACFTAGLYEESISNAKKNIERFGSAVSRDPFLIASYSMLGRMEEAKESAQQWLKGNPSFTLSSWKLGRLYKRPEDRERLYGALRRAGLK